MADWRRRFFVSGGWRVWTGHDWHRGPDGAWRTSGYRYFRLWSPLDWLRWRSAR